jgi:hypothetical protein
MKLSIPFYVNKNNMVRRMELDEHVKVEENWFICICKAKNYMDNKRYKGNADSVTG